MHNRNTRIHIFHRTNILSHPLVRKLIYAESSSGEEEFALTIYTSMRVICANRLWNKFFRNNATSPPVGEAEQAQIARRIVIDLSERFFTLLAERTYEFLYPTLDGERSWNESCVRNAHLTTYLFSTKILDEEGPRNDESRSGLSVVSFS